MSHYRHLAAIMFADIQGFTALMESDEELSLNYRDKLKQKLEEEVKTNGGRIIKLSGDGALCSFDSALDALKAAIAVQLHMQIEPIVPLRIGIHQADVVFDESDVHGDGVNIASRLESLAVPGSIFISAKVHDDIKNHPEIRTVSLGKYQLKNVTEPVEIFAVSNVGLQVPLHKKLEGKGVKFVTKTISVNKKALFTRLLLLVAALAVAGFLVIPKMIHTRNARNTLIPQIRKMTEDEFIPSTKAFALAKEAEKYIPGDSALLTLWPRIATKTTFLTEPGGADVYWKDYNDFNGEWKHIGKTPLRDAWIPKGFPRIKIEKQGFSPVFSPASFFSPITIKLKLDPERAIPTDMVHVRGKVAELMIVGLEQNAGKYVGDFLIDRLEVTNEEYKRFTDAGGYREKKYWDQPIYSNGKELTWEKAMELFHDKTNQPGPAAWEAGSYPNGKEHHPVTGVSWYEAMAYSKFVNKILPTVYHWSLVANTLDVTEIIPNSNFNGTGTVDAGSMNGTSFWGVVDIAGNAREWCLNERENKEQRFILGGGWNDATYSFNDGNYQPTLDRSLSNGFRCMKLLPGDRSYSQLSGPVSLAFRDYSSEKPVPDETFEIFRRQYAYDHTPLEPTTALVMDSGYAKVEKIELNTTYNKERMIFYLYLPKNVSPPYQAVFYFPGSGDIHQRNFKVDNIYYKLLFDFLLKNGRAVIYPVFKGTFERGDELRSDLQEETVFYKEHVISWAQDVSRSLDYLDTRKDIVTGKYGYYGFSWGSAIGPVICATEKRFKAAVLHVGGLMMQKTYPEVDVFNFLPRMKLPTLMLNGKNDTFFPLESSQKPMFEFLGAPQKDKKIIIFEGGHLVPRSELIKESLYWFDKYLGPVK